MKAVELTWLLYYLDKRLETEEQSYYKKKTEFKEGTISTLKIIKQDVHKLIKGVSL